MTVPAQEHESPLRFTHLDKLYGYLPGLAEALPGIFGLDAAAYDAVLAEYAEQAKAAAEVLLHDTLTPAVVRDLPFAPGDRVLAVGDSVTDDLLSWAELLRHLLDAARPDDGITVVNAGLSAHTTAMVLRRWPSLLAEPPDWVLCCLGGNDVTRIDGGKPQVSAGESLANLGELRRIAGTGVRWVWLTPVPVDEERAAAHPPFRFGRSSWSNADIVALADGVAELPLAHTGGPTERPDPVIDLVARFGTPPPRGPAGPRRRPPEPDRAAGDRRGGRGRAVRCDRGLGGRRRPVRGADGPRRVVAR